MVPVGDGVYETSMYLAKGFDVKFYQARDWGSARSTQILEPIPANIVNKSVAGKPEYCVFNGDMIPVPTSPPEHTLFVPTSTTRLYIL